MNLLYGNDKRGQYPDSWYTATAKPLEEHPPLRGSERAELCIIGAGFTGLSAALHAAKSGLDVIVLDAQRIGFGASGRNGGQVSGGFNKDQQALEKTLGKTDAKALWLLAEDAKKLTLQLIRDHAPEANPRFGIAHTQWHVRDVSASHQYAELLREEYGYDQFETLDRGQTQNLIGSPAYQGGILDRGAFHIHPLHYAFGLARACLERGVRFFETSPVHAIQQGSPAKIQTDQGHVTAEHLIIATNGYGTGLDRKTANRIMPINNFIVATEPLTDRNSSILTQDIAVADSKFVVNYFRLSEDNRLLFGGGESYGYEFPTDIAAKVRKPMLEVFPELEDVRIDYAWGGTLAITMQRLPYVKRIASNTLAAGGYSGHGVALAGLTGKILAEAITGRTKDFDLLSRLPCPSFPGGSAFRTPLLALAMTWFSLRDRIGL